MSFEVDSPAFFSRFFLGQNPYPWQDEAVEAVAARKHSRVALVAANGSGKTACVNVALLLWFLWKHPQGIAMVTSGSWNQLKTQLWPNLEMYRSVFPHWKWQADRIRTPEGGFIAAYSTIHPGRAEGHHEHLPERPVMLMVDEAKSVPENIFEALSRCTPTYFVLTSSPGKPSGTFYQAFRRNRKVWYTVQVNAHMCPHIMPERIELARQLYGEDHPVYRSMILGEFTEGDDAMMIPRYLVERALTHPCKPRTGTRTAAVDWAAGGDETVLAERNGNQLRILWKDREKDTVKAAKRVVAECNKRGIEQGRVFGDECGIGLTIMQSAQHYEKFRFRPFNGGAKVPDPQKQLHFLNLNAYAWHLFRQGLERGEICFPDGLDETTIDQLCDRYMEWNEKGVIQLEKKEDMRERGLNSPDRADALIMAWYGGRFTNYDDTPVEVAHAPQARFRF